MPKEFDRTRRVAEQIQRELAQLIQFQLKDPRLGMVTVSAVDLSRDFSNAKVYVTVFGKEGAAEQAVSVLQHAAGFLRHELGKALHIRTIPQLHFYFDESIARGAHIDSLIVKALARDSESKKEDDDGQ